MGWWVEKTLPKISETIERKAIEFLPDNVTLNSEEKNQRNNCHIIYYVKYGSTNSKNAQATCFMEMQFLNKVTLQNFEA